MSRTFTNILMTLTLTTTFFLMTANANADFGRTSSTSVKHSAGAVGVGAAGPRYAGGMAAVGSATSVNHDVTRTTPLGTVNRNTNVNTATRGVAAAGPNGGFRAGAAAGSVSHSRTAVR